MRSISKFQGGLEMPKGSPSMILKCFYRQTRFLGEIEIFRLGPRSVHRSFSQNLTTAHVLGCNSAGNGRNRKNQKDSEN